MKPEIAKPHALVTGAAGGIGLAIALRLEADGCRVTRVDVKPGAGVEQCDISDEDAVVALARRIGPVNVLVNNAAVWRFSALEDTTTKDFSDVLRVNVLGSFLMTRTFGKAMIEAGAGSIVNIVSIAALHANPSVGAYSSSKAALVALTRQTALEWGPRGVRCNAVGPGLVPTDGAGFYADAQVRAARAAAVPLGRLGSVEDIADVVAFLAGPRAAYVNGQVIYVDGGLSGSLMTFLPRPANVPGPQLKRGD